MSFLRSSLSVFRVLRDLANDAVMFLWSSFHPRTALIAENLFLRKQLTFYQEHQVRPRRLTNATRLSLLFWSRFFEWKSALLMVKPATLIGWHRKAFRLLWKWKSRRVGHSRLPAELQQMIVHDNPTWGEERIADELWLKLGIRVSPRTVRAYWPTEDKPHHPRPASQSWNTFVRNHARVLLACDFMVAVTARFRILYIFVVMEIGSRRILHCNVTARPTADWTMQQLRDAIPSDHPYRFLLHDRHATFSSELDTAVAALGVRALKTPVRTPQANAFCERLIGTIRRECLDFLIALNERHLRAMLREWVSHYNQGRPHSRLGPGIPDRGTAPPWRKHRHRLEATERVTSTAILGGLQHEYGLERTAA